MGTALSHCRLECAPGGGQGLGRCCPGLPDVLTLELLRAQIAERFCQQFQRSNGLQPRCAEMVSRLLYSSLDSSRSGQMVSNVLCSRPWEAFGVKSS